jgi:hypothetical protein
MAPLSFYFIISLSALGIYKVPYLTGKFPSYSFWTSCQVSPHCVYIHFNINNLDFLSEFLSQCDFRRTDVFRQITHFRADSALTPCVYSLRVGDFESPTRLSTWFLDSYCPYRTEVDTKNDEYMWNRRNKHMVK